MTITRFQPGKRMSQAVRHGDTVYLAGQVATNMNGTIEEQTREVVAAIDALLAEAGTDKSRVLYCQVVLNNIAAGKLDYYLSRSVRFQRIGCGPTRDVQVTVTLRNNAPSTALPSYVVGRLDQPDGPTQPGDNRTLMDYYATAGAQLLGVTIDGQQGTAAVLQERGHPVYRIDLELPRGVSREVTLHLREPAGSGPLQVWRQPGVTPVDVSGVDQACS